MNQMYKKWGWTAIGLSLALTAFWTQAQTITKSSWIQSIENQRVYFDTAKTSLNGQTREQLAEVAGRLGQLYGDFAIEVTGHTDSKGDADINLKISQLRALAVVDYLSRHNVHHHAYLIQSKGEYAPLASNETEEGRSLNRRVELKIIAQDLNAISLLGGTQPETDLQAQAWAQVEVPAEAAEDHQTVSDELPIEEQLLDDVEQQQEQAMQEEETKPADLPLNTDSSIESTLPVTKQPTPHPQEDMSISGVKARHERKYTNDDYYISSYDGKIKLRDAHIYDLRKKPGKGTAQILVGPAWVKLMDLQDAGATSSSQKSEPSFVARLRWISVMEDNENIFVGLGGFARWSRFDQNIQSGFVQEQEEWTFGGHALAGVFITPNVSLMLEAGYEGYLFLRPDGANLRLDNDYVVRAGPSLEAVVWRFAPKGDVGFGLHGAYMDFGQGDVKGGWTYGAKLFADYSVLRLGFEWSQIDLDTDFIDTNYRRWALTASFFY